MAEPPPTQTRLNGQTTGGLSGSMEGHTEGQLHLKAMSPNH